VSWHNQSSKWKTEIRFVSKKWHLGYFAAEDEAAAAYTEAERARV
jgi:hypothetical protein